ncbi:hypothetical protein SAMN02745823_00932 [Sporobacter termitidis DSM 10068]|uniref:Uncharacterized protein n=1 Tax=Sporobacter termitidis DSM 10068 TaxID=1123282 RepID=A0A1M5VPL6_9FIRM|nr:hypothetical protein SAMN02745823_00932 [Sporobacter termitidis DSM 10068]
MKKRVGKLLYLGHREGFMIRFNNIIITLIYRFCVNRLLIICEFKFVASRRRQWAASFSVKVNFVTPSLLVTKMSSLWLSRIVLTM